MKTIKALFLGLLTLSMSACDLTEKPYGMYAKENMYSTEMGAQSILLSAYAAYTTWEYMYLTYYIGDLTTDLAYNNRLDDQPYPEFTEWKLDLIKDNDWNRNMFRVFYRSIHSTCDIIENIKNGSLNQDAENRILGEAHFLRGFAYFNLAWRYGLVPMKLVTSESFPVKAKSLDEVYGQIIQDLIVAESLLKINPSPGCADKVATWSMLAKTYLTIASAKSSGVPLYKDMSYDVNDAYKEAAKWAKLVVDNPTQTVYSLDPDLGNVYDLAHINGPEHIFTIAHNRESGVDAEYSKIPRFFLPANNGNSYYVNDAGDKRAFTVDGWSICVPSQKLQDDMRAASPSDKRVINLIRDEIYHKMPDGSFKTESMSPNGPTRYNYCIKYVDPLAEGTERTSAHTLMIRFADIALVYAEALGKGSGIEWLNKVTERASGKHYNAGEFADDTEFRAAVLKERGFELYFEAQRLADLRRTNNVRKMVHGKAAPNRPVIDLSKYTDEQLTFYPLPQREIDLNPNL